MIGNARLSPAGAVSRPRGSEIGFVCAGRHDASRAIEDAILRRSRHSASPSCSRSRDVTPALAEWVDSTAIDVVHRMENTAEFKDRLPRNQGGSAHHGWQCAEIGAGGPLGQAAQMRLPSANLAIVDGSSHSVLGGIKPVHRCGRNNPADSRFCSFCGSDLSNAFQTTAAQTHESANGIFPRAELGRRLMRGPTPQPTWDAKAADPRPCVRRGVGRCVVRHSDHRDGIINYIQQASQPPARVQEPPSAFR